MDARRLLRGDWTPLVRDGIDVLRLLLVGGAAYHALAGEAGSAAVLAVMAAVTLVPRGVQLPRVYDLSVTVAMVLQGFGEVWGLYEWRSDAWLATNLSEGNDGTDGDLDRDSLGSLAGAAVVVVWARFGCGSVRRIPGGNTHEEVDA